MFRFTLVVGTSGQYWERMEVDTLKLIVLKLLDRVCSLAIILILLSSSIPHLNNPFSFLSTVYSYKLVDINSGTLVAAALPFWQVYIGFCLLARIWLLQSYASSMLLFVSFAIVQIVTIQRGLNIPCGCFGTSDTTPIGAYSLTIAIIGIVLSLIGFILRYHWLESPLTKAP
jgi:hypothetical protein